MKLTNFGRPSHGHHYYTFNLSIQCVSVEHRVKKMMYFDYITFMLTPQHKNSLPGVIKFTILVDHSLVIIVINLAFLIHAPE